jgi:broad specificity phosphatase PhoE
MSYLILIRHSNSQQQPGVSTHEWALSDEGRARCEALAAQIRPYDVKAIFSSHEPKAIQTAEALVRAFDEFDSQIIDGLEETHRATSPYYKNVGDFQAAIIAAMQRPHEVVFGEEAFEEARLRLDRTLDTLMEKHPDETVAAVSHGTIMALWLAPLLNRSVEDVWQAMGMPAYAVIEWPTKHVIHFQENVE